MHLDPPTISDIHHLRYDTNILIELNTHKLNKVGPIVKEHMQEAQNDKQRIYICQAHLIEFNPEDSVFLLDENCKLLGTCQVSYRVP